jgi:hypothetical protein
MLPEVLRWSHLLPTTVSGLELTTCKEFYRYGVFGSMPPIRREQRELDRLDRRYHKEVQ